MIKFDFITDSNVFSMRSHLWFHYGDKFGNFEIVCWEKNIKSIEKSCVRKSSFWTWLRNDKMSGEVLCAFFFFFFFQLFLQEFLSIVKTSTLLKCSNEERTLVLLSFKIFSFFNLEKKDAPTKFKGVMSNSDKNYVDPVHKEFKVWVIFTRTSVYQLQFQILRSSLLLT